MGQVNSQHLLLGALLLGCSGLFMSSGYAAKPVDLSHQPMSTLNMLMSQSASLTNGAMRIKETSRAVDLKKTTHVRVQQMYDGHMVWGADAVAHIPHGEKAAGLITPHTTMNGKVYVDLKADLASTPPAALTDAQAQKATQFAVQAFEQKRSIANMTVKDKASQLMVYVDKANRAHWAYLVNFYVDPNSDAVMPAKPAYILDAVTFTIYQQWDDVKTVREETMGGGFGGNKKMGELVYDDLEGDLPRLHITRDDEEGTCFLQNKDVTVKSSRTRKVISFDCSEIAKDHNDVYWDADLDKVNGGYSPGNDALFGGMMIKDMYQNWYDIPVLTSNGKPMMLNMVVHLQMDNAYWDGQRMSFGDGISMFYPLTSLGVAAHEISHGFTEQHSGLRYYGQSGGMNEAFSDMAAQAAEFYAYGKNSWQIGPEIFKEEDEALRYMDMPSKDCKGGKPGNWCSIDEVSQYSSGLDVHYSSGVYNRVFYLLGTAEDWNTKKAFDVMLDANRYYWTSETDFTEGACGVLKATSELGYDVGAVKKAFKTVGISKISC